VIGEAKGILMERFWLTEEQAFDLLKRVASEQETKVRDIAAELVRTRQLPPGRASDNPRGE
jgi:AmiR/NasT family two-component response regulator